MIKKITVGLLAIAISVSAFPCIVQAHVIKSNRNALYYYYNMLPVNVQEYLEDSNCTISINNSKMLKVKIVGEDADKYSAENVGLTQQDVDAYGYVHSANIYIKDGHEEVVLHEIGHVMANYKGNCNAWAETDAWNYIFEHEKDYIPMDAYSTSSPSEYFAESFSWFILQPQQLYDYAPMTWQYINAVVERA